MTHLALPDIFYTAYFIHDCAVHVHEACLSAYVTLSQACSYIDEDTGDLFSIMETERVQKSGIALTLDASDKVANYWLRTRAAEVDREGLYVVMSDFPRFVQLHADPLVMDNIIGQINEAIRIEHVSRRAINN